MKRSISAVGMYNFVKSAAKEINGNAITGFIYSMKWRKVD